MQARIMAHGGAWDWDDALDAGKHKGLDTAIQEGQNILNGGGSALDAVEKTVIALENNPVFYAGIGGYLNQDGIVQLDALIIDGSRHDFGAVAGATGQGEQIMRALLSKHACDQIVNGANAMEAAKKSTDYFYSLFGDSMSALIVIDKHGNLGASQTAPKMAFGWVDKEGKIRTAMKSSELLA